MCIYIPFYMICIKNWFLFLKTHFGPYLLFARRFHIIPYSNYGFSIFSNFEGHTLRSGV